MANIKGHVSNSQIYNTQGISPWVIELDYREVDLTSTAGTKTYASRTVAASELFNSRDGANGEIDKVELVAVVTYSDDSGSANGLNLTTAAHNQWQINVAAGGADDLPFPNAGSLNGQHITGDFEVVGNGADSVTLIANVSDLTTSTLKDNVDQAIVVTLLNGRSIGNNLRLKVATFLRVYYNARAG